MAQSIDGDSRIIYVPVETRAREWDGKLLLSLIAASANFQVVIGPKWMINTNIERLPLGFYGCKTLNRMDAGAMEVAASLGHTVYAWDEEGPGQVLPEIYLKSIDRDAVERADRIFAWGEHQAKMLSGKFPKAAGKIEVAGNPRWDLLRREHRGFFSAEAQTLRNAHGRMILLNTNFGTYNSWFVDGIESIAKIAADTGAFEKSNEADQRTLNDIHNFEKGVFQSYAALLPVLSSAFPDHTIVVRPHPTEKHGVWADLAAPLPNVKALHEGAVIPWILAADAVVQNSCTTGVEALTLGKPVVSYCKFETPLLEWHLASHVTPRAVDETELVNYLRRFIADPSSFAPYNAQGLRVLDRHIAKLSGETSATAIIKALHFAAKRREKNHAQFDRAFSLPHGLQPYLRTKYIATKFPPISGSDLVEMLSRLTREHPRLGQVAITQVAESMFHVRRKA